MASSKPRLNLTFSPASRRELKEIYAFNAEHHSPAHADRYEEFLLAGISQLATSYEDGKPVNGFPSLRGVTLRRRSRGHGHIVVYRVDVAAETVRILHVYHTAQDVQGRLEREGNT